MPLSLLNLNAEALRGLGRVVRAMALQGALLPLGTLVFFSALLMVAPASASLAAVAFSASSLTTAAISYVMWRGAAPRCGSAEGTTTLGTELLAASRPLFWVSVLNMAMVWGPTLLLGLLSDNRSLGEFAITNRTAMLVGFVLVAVNGTIAPRIASHHSANEIQALERLVRRTASAVLLVAGPAVIVVAAAPGSVLSLFGSGFAGASWTMTVLALGQLANIATGSAGTILMMTGHERALRSNVLIATSIGLLLCVLLIPLWGSLGAAIGAAVGVATLNVASAFAVKRLLRISALPSYARILGIRSRTQ